MVIHEPGGDPSSATKSASPLILELLVPRIVRKWSSEKCWEDWGSLGRGPTSLCPAEKVPEAETNRQGNTEDRTSGQVTSLLVLPGFLGHLVPGHSLLHPSGLGKSMPQEGLLLLLLG